MRLVAVFATCAVVGCPDQSRSPPSAPVRDDSSEPLSASDAAVVSRRYPAQYDQPTVRAISVEPHVYGVGEVTRGYAIAVVVEQLGADIRFELRCRGDDKYRIEVDQVGGESGREATMVEARAGCDYQLRIAAALPRRARGQYKLLLTTPRMPSHDDELRIRGFAHERRGHVFDQRAGDGLQAARDEWSKAIALWRAVGDSRARARAMDRLARTHDLLGDNTKALSLRKRARTIQRDIGDTYGEAVTLFGLGRSQASMGHPDTAVASYEQAIRLAKQVEAPVLEAKAIHNLGTTYADLGDLQRAIDYIEQSKVTFERLDRPSNLAVELYELGTLYQRVGDIDLARQHYERAHGILTRLNLKWDAGRVMQALATLYLGPLAQTARGAHALQSALQLHREAGDRRGEIDALTLLGRHLAAVGDVERGCETHAQAVALVEEMNERLRAPRALLGYGQCLILAAELDRGKRLLERALTLARELRVRPIEAASLLSLAKVEHSLGNRRAARGTIERALAIVEGIRAGLAHEGDRAGYFSSVRDYYEFYIEVLLEQPTASNVRRALIASEQARARILVETLNRSAVSIRGAAPERLLARQQALEHRVHALETRYSELLARGGTERQRRSAERALSSAIRSRAKLRDKIRSRAPRYSELMQARELTISALQQQLADDGLVVEYFLGERVSFAWTISSRHVRVHRLARRAVLEDLARRAYQLLTSRNRKLVGENAMARKQRVANADLEFETVAQELSRAILVPVLRGMTARRLFVVSDGALQFIPVAALPVESDGRIIDHYELVSLPAASLLMTGPQRSRQVAQQSIAIIADPVFSGRDPRVSEPARPLAVSASEFPRLRFSRIEAESIASIAPGAFLALDFDASRSLVIGDKLRNYRIVHFASHGVVNSQYPALSSIVLSLVNAEGQPQAGALRLGDIYNLRLNADLVVLSACETAFGKLVRGEGIVGLMRGFLYAGARQVVATLWQIHDRATATLMRHFYTAMLGRNAHPADALRRAQRAVQSQPHWQSPYYWAAFGVHGSSS